MGIVYICIAGILLGIFATMIFEFILKKNKKLRQKYYVRHKILWGRHIHHSVYGLIFIAVSAVLFLWGHISIGTFYLAFGVGIIIQHTLSDGRFVFIEKQRR